MVRFARVSSAVALIMLVACDSPSQPSQRELRGGMLLTFDVAGERFRVWITNQSAIDQALALQRGTSDAKIPVGRLRRGPGQGSHNVPYHWHMDPDDIGFAQVVIELCDGTPSFVEDNVDYFAGVVVRYCPWSARLVRLDDYR